MCVIKTKQSKEIRSSTCIAAEVFAYVRRVSLIQSVLMCPWVITTEEGSLIWVNEPDDKQTHSSVCILCSEQS